MRIATLLSVGTLAATSHATPVQYAVDIDKVIDTNDPGISDAGTIDGFLLPGIDGDQIVFAAVGSTSGFYRYRRSTGTFEVLADNTMTVPGVPAFTYTAFASGTSPDVLGFAMDDDHVVFSARYRELYHPEGINYVLLTDINDDPATPTVETDVVTYLTNTTLGVAAGLPTTAVPGPWPALNDPMYMPDCPFAASASYLPVTSAFRDIPPIPSLEDGRIWFGAYYEGRFEIGTSGTGTSEKGIFVTTPGDINTFEQVENRWIDPEFDPYGWLLDKPSFGTSVGNGTLLYMSRTNFELDFCSSRDLVIIEQHRVRRPDGTVETIARSANFNVNFEGFAHDAELTQTNPTTGQQENIFIQGGDPVPSPEGHLMWDLGGENSSPPPVINDEGTKVVLWARTLPGDREFSLPFADDLVTGIYLKDLETGALTKIITSVDPISWIPGDTYDSLTRPTISGDTVAFGAFRYNDIGARLNSDMLVWRDGELIRLLGENDFLQGRTVRLTGTSREGIDGDTVAMKVWFTNGDQGIYTATLTPLCPLDLNFNGVIDVADLLAFLQFWFGGEDDADWNEDGDVDVNDLLQYLAGWFKQSETGCP